jgi:hypothetical protein
MMKISMRNALCAAGGAALLTQVMPALAALGGNADSVEADRVQLRGQMKVSTGASFTVHEITLPTRTVLREYLSPTGKIFAVTWHGPTTPDLQQMLGSYYTTFRTTVNSASRMQHDHHHLTVSQPGLVVQSSGQMRLHHGLVYVPALVPQGVSLSDVQ